MTNSLSSVKCHLSYLIWLLEIWNWFGCWKFGIDSLGFENHPFIQISEFSACKNIILSLKTSFLCRFFGASTNLQNKELMPYRMLKPFTVFDLIFFSLICGEILITLQPNSWSHKLHKTGTSPTFRKSFSVSKWSMSKIQKVVQRKAIFNMQLQNSRSGTWRSELWVRWKLVEGTLT